MKSKKFLLLVVVAFVSALINVSCSDDDNPTQGPTLDERLVGNWTLIKVTIPQNNTELTPEEAGIMITGKVSADGDMEVTTIENSETTVETATWSTSNGKLLLKSGGDTETMDYSVNVNIVSITASLENDFGMEFPAIFDFRVE